MGNAWLFKTGKVQPLGDLQQRVGKLAPREERTLSGVRETLVRLGDGRELEVVEAGDPSGPAIFVQNGTTMGAGLFAPHVTDAVQRGLRLVSYGRPGYGRSTRHRGRTVAQAAADTATVADHLGIRRFAILGHSGGGPHTLACAALLPDRVVAVATFAGLAPADAPDLDFAKGMGRTMRTIAALARSGEATLMPWLEAYAANLLAAGAAETAEKLAQSAAEPDQSVLRSALGFWMVTVQQEAARLGILGTLDDFLAFDRPWGFSVTDIRVPVQIWQGWWDQSVPYGHGVWLGEHIPTAEVHLTPDDGHVTFLAHAVPEVHAWLAARF